MTPMREKLAPCGDRCDLCPRFQATLSGEESQLKKVAQLLHQVGWTRELLPPDKMVCHGCIDIPTCEYGVKECCNSNQVANCGRCQWYKCLTVERMLQKTRANAEKFRQILPLEEYETFWSAFFQKQENLEAERKKAQKSVSCTMAQMGYIL